jgi:hypothetical protein
MREVEATFRDASEMTNSRAVWWSLVQIGVLVGAAIWQMRYLKVSSWSECTGRVGLGPALTLIRSTLKTRSLDDEMYDFDVRSLLQTTPDASIIYNHVL